MPRRYNTCHQECNQSSMEDKRRERRPRIFIRIDICDFLAITIFPSFHKHANTIASLAQFSPRPFDSIAMGKFVTLQGILIEVIVAPDEWVLKILPDGRCSIQRTDNDTQRKHCEQEHEVPAGENSEEM